MRPGIWANNRPRQSPRFTKYGPLVSSDQSGRNVAISRDAGRITPPAGGRGKRATAARGCVRPASRRLPRRGGAGDVVGGLGRGLRHGRFRGQHRLDRRIRAFELHGELGDLGGDVVDALAQQRVFHPLGLPGAFGLLLDRVDVTLQFGALVAGDTKLLLDRGFLAAQFLDDRRFAAVRRRDLLAQFASRRVRCFRSPA